MAHVGSSLSHMHPYGRLIRLELLRPVEGHRQECLSLVSCSCLEALTATSSHVMKMEHSVVVSVVILLGSIWKDNASCTQHRGDIVHSFYATL